MKFELHIKTKLLKNKEFSCFKTKLLDVLFIMLIVDILISMSRINFKFSSVEPD